MLAETQLRRQVSVRFNFPGEPGCKKTEILVNPFLPLLNYKGEIEQQSKINLFGKKMQFKYAKSQEEIYKIEYLQDIEVKSKIPLKNQLDILVILEEIGG